MTRIEAIIAKLFTATPEQLSAIENVFGGQPVMPSDTTVVTQREASRMLGLSSTTVYRLLNAGRLSPVLSPGGQRKVLRQSIADYLAQGKKQTVPSDRVGLNPDMQT